jgi:hypothetical protein
MSCYRVTFFKNLLSSDGHPFKCVQRVFEVRRARSADRALEAAELRYERLHRGHDWTFTRISWSWKSTARRSIIARG